MPAISFTSGLGKNLGFSSSGEDSIPDSLKFPLNTVIPYYGNTPNIAGWERYAAGDGKAIYSATTQAQIGTTLAEQLARATPSSLNTGGSHLSGGAAPLANMGGTAGTGMLQQATAVGHTHTASGTLTSGDNMKVMNTQKVTLLRATKSKLTLPPQALVVNENELPNSTQFTSASPRYLVGANNDITTTNKTNINVSGGVTVASGGFHAHSTGSTTYSTPLSGTTYYTNYNFVGAGSHTHSASVTLTQSQIASKLVKLWQLTTSIMPKTDIIVMYVGTLSLLPSTWKLCNGLNGTPNLGGYVIGYRGNDWNITTVADASSVMSINADNNTHNHLSGPVGTRTRGSMGGYHGSYTNYHTHTGNSSTTAYLPPRIALAFIQYKG